MTIAVTHRRSSVVLAITFCVVLLVSVSAGFAESFDRMVIFGDSLSDPGNHFAAFGMTSQAPFSPLPDFPYAIGGHHFSNGATWAEQLSHALGVPNSGKPALREPGVFTNYAVGRARARAGAPEFPDFDLSTQVRQFLTDFRGRAPSNALYVIWIGANDLDDALIAAQTDPTIAAAIIRAAVTTLAGNVYALWGAGARNVMILNLPDPALAPFIRALGPSVQAAASQAGMLYNAALDQAVMQVRGLPGLQLVRFDVKGVFDDIVATQGDADGINVTDACLSFGVAVHAVCKHPNRYLFWDGAHPTKAGHRLIAEAALRLFDDDAE